MIYLIGGAPRCGKTKISRQLAKELSCFWISADAIESAVAASVAKKDIPRLFPKSILRKKTKQSNDLMYAKYSTKEITAAYVKQSKASWPAIKKLAQCALREGQDLIIEGHQVHPRLIAKLIRDLKIVKGIIVVRTDLNSIISGALKNVSVDDWFIKKTTNPITYKKIALMIKAYSTYFINESNKFGLKVIDTNNDFKQKIDRAVKYLR